MLVRRASCKTEGSEEKHEQYGMQASCKTEGNEEKHEQHGMQSAKSIRVICKIAFKKKNLQSPSIQSNW